MDVSNVTPRTASANSFSDFYAAKQPQPPPPPPPPSLMEGDGIDWAVIGANFFQIFMCALVGPVFNVAVDLSVRRAAPTCRLHARDLLSHLLLCSFRASPIAVWTCVPATAGAQVAHARQFRPQRRVLRRRQRASGGGARRGVPGLPVRPRHARAPHQRRLEAREHAGVRVLLPRLPAGTRPARRRFARVGTPRHVSSLG
eukprot:scaffold129857_cov66-Phaeocystis_antarctica.AAC.1